MADQMAPGAQEAIAVAKYIRTSPTKARQVVDLIRGRHVDDARRVLRFTPRAASAPVAKALESAVANAEHNGSLPADELMVTRAWVDEGPTLRRFRPRALGRATRIRKRTCHIAVVVGRPVEEPEETERPAPSRRSRRPDAGKPDERKPERKKSTRKSTSKTTARDAKTTRKSTRKSTSKKTTAKKTTTKKTTAKKTSAKKTTRKRDS
jgi:large subunit ribosomal protein L22